MRHLAFICLLGKKNPGEEDLRQKCCQLHMRGSNGKLLMVWDNVLSMSPPKKQPALCCVFSLCPPCLALRTREQMILAITVGCYFNSEIMVTLCGMRGQESLGTSPSPKGWGLACVQTLGISPRAQSGGCSRLLT